jgi:hypothetical protein
VRLALVCITATGCMPSIVQSALVETSDLSAVYTIRTENDGSTTASAKYRWVSGDADVLLGDGDTASIDGMVLVDETAALYTIGVAPTAEHAFVLERPGREPIEHRGHPIAPFAITSAPITGTYDVEATLTWAPARPDLTVQIIARSADLRCPSRTLTDGSADTGSFAFTGADVKPGGEMPPACAFALEVIRSEVAAGTPSRLSSVTLVSRHVAATSMSLH